jgi:hypothetical protein
VQAVCTGYIDNDLESLKNKNNNSKQWRRSTCIFFLRLWLISKIIYLYTIHLLQYIKVASLCVIFNFDHYEA